MPTETPAGPAGPTPTTGPTPRPGAARPDPTRPLRAVAAVHALLVAVPLLVVGVVVLPPLVAVLLAPLVGVVATLLRCRDLDERLGAALGAVPVDPTRHPRLVNLVEAQAMAVGVTPPALHVVDDDAANAVSWGVGLGPGALAVTTGLLAQVERIELEAVVAHLLTGLRDRATLGPSAVQALLGPLASGPLAGPVAALAGVTADDRRLVQADLEGVRATRYPPGAVAALERLETLDTHVGRSPSALQPLWLAAPAPAGPDDPFAVHPPLADRADLLREL